MESLGEVLSVLVRGDNLVFARKVLQELRGALVNTLTDPVTLDLMDLPLLTCSDGQTYGASTLVGLARHAAMIRSPITRELIRGGCVVNHRLMKLAEQFCVAMPTHPGLEELHKRTTSISIIRELLPMTHTPLPKPIDVLTQEFTINFEGRAAAFGDFCALLQIQTQLLAHDVVTFKGVVDSQEHGKLTMLTPRPCKSLISIFVALGRAFSVLGAIANPECIGMLLITSPKVKHLPTLEKRLLLCAESTHALTVLSKKAEEAM